MKTIEELKAAISEQARRYEDHNDREHAVFGQSDLLEECADDLGIERDSRLWQDLRDYQWYVVEDEHYGREFVPGNKE